MEKLKLNLDGKKMTVNRKDYVRLKTKDLKGFGYNNLTEQEVDDAVTKALEGKAEDVISMFVESDLDLEKS
jgi:hypothetical protein